MTDKVEKKLPKINDHKQRLALQLRSNLHKRKMKVRSLAIKESSDTSDDSNEYVNDHG